MKQLVPVSFLLQFLLFATIPSTVRAQDLPGAPSNWQTAPAGTLVIAMDNVNQACSVPTGGTYLFNLKSYGLAVFLLDVNYKLQWAIRSGKTKDAVDFSAIAERVLPNYTAATSYDFQAGPILIFPQDTAGANYAIRVFNSALPDSCKVKVYKLTADALVDVRYTLTRPPKAALFNDSCDIHRNFMEMASVPTMNYDCVPNALTLRSGCYTIATDPHTVPGQLSPYDADSIYNFVMAGGNFLAECEGVKTFETLKQYQSVTGVLVDPPSPQSAQYNNNVMYDNADMAFAQYQGIYRPWTRGAVKLWTYASANTNNFYSVVRCRRNADINYQFGATVSKLTADTGSVVFYLGNHEFFTHDCHTCVGGAANSEAEVNGIRMYLNAVLVPSKFLNCVNVYDIPLAVIMGDFTATKRSTGGALLKWTSLTERDHSRYFIEHSADGKNYKTVGEIAGKGDSEIGYAYEFFHKETNKGINYYRLRLSSNGGKQTFSEVRKLLFGGNDQLLNIFPNPATGMTSLLIDSRDGDKIQVRVYDLAGREVLQTGCTVQGQKTELNIDKLVRGLYSIIVTTENGMQHRGRLIVAN
ncbi:MAG TPA: T9SS type A sorting domain-containing protein [Chitinophagaceae bacterium]|nr:T9SS type A sorting domain-containing protein [Chitinophagaceae bacterium]